jgi:hypothetical protein
VWWWVGGWGIPGPQMRGISTPQTKTCLWGPRDPGHPLLMVNERHGTWDTPAGAGFRRPPHWVRLLLPGPNRPPQPPYGMGGTLPSIRE